MYINEIMQKKKKQCLKNKPHPKEDEAKWKKKWV